jgi:hypothetical protein
MLPFMLAWGTLLPALCLAVAGWSLALLVPLFFFGGALAAITYNDLVRKGKTLGQVVRTFPLLLAYYHLRLLGYVGESLRLRTRPSGIERVDLSAQAGQR